MKATDDATRADLMADRYLASAPGIGVAPGWESVVTDEVRFFLAGVGVGILFATFVWLLAALERKVQ